jgi:co-chaperonin GroES (HSP10)
MTPLNRHLRIKIIRQEPPDTGGVLLPDDYKVVQEWEAGKVEAVASDCEKFSSEDVGCVVSFPGNLLVCVDVLGEQHHFVQENYIVCKYGGKE